MSNVMEKDWHLQEEIRFWVGESCCVVALERG
jgi:hypothetical protein